MDDPGCGVWVGLGDDALKTLSGIRLIHQCPPGAKMKLMPDGRAIVAPVDDRPYVVNTDGSVERFMAAGGVVYVEQEVMVWKW